MKKSNGKFHKQNVVVAARLAMYYTQTGSTLVLTTTKPIVETIAECLISLLQKQPLAVSPEIQQIVNECTELLGSEHLLVKAVALGFCYHHAELPNVVRRRIENAVRDNIIPLIVSTTTLSQGVNLPIKNVIVHSLSMHNKISMAQYANAVGRAGRAGSETEGHIIFCDRNDLEMVRQEVTTEVSESFIVSGIRHLTQSRLFSLETTEDFLSLSSYDVFKNLPELTESLKIDSIDPLIGWLQGKDYKELADLYFDGKTEIVVKKLEKVTHAFSWGFNSLIRHLNFYLNRQNIPKIFNNLTSFVTHGVSTTAAVYAMSLGVHDRQFAIIISKTYQAIHSETNYSTFKEWLFNLEFGQWVEILQAHTGSSRKIEECFDNIQRKQQTLQSNQKVFDCMFISVDNSANVDSSIQLDELILVEFNDDLWMTTYDYQKYWQLSGVNIDKLKQFNRQMQDIITQQIDFQQSTVKISVH
ncbi:hypothetical protein NUACC21_67230 [Scytonema sp. NUACC21]